MSTALTLFERTFEGASVRIVMVDGDPWFVAVDVAKLLGYANPQKAVRTHCRNARAVSTFEGVTDSVTPLDPQTLLIPEPDVYRLIMRSNLPAAARFEEWVVGTVLPSIRKTGSYSTAIPLDNPEALRDALLGYTTQVIALKEQVVTLDARAGAAEARIVKLEPQARLWRQFLDAKGLVSLTDFAKAARVERKWLINKMLIGFLCWCYRRGDELKAADAAVKTVPPRMELRFMEIKRRDGSMMMIPHPYLTARGAGELEVFIDRYRLETGITGIVEYKTAPSISASVFRKPGATPLSGDDQ